MVVVDLRLASVCASLEQSCDGGGLLMYIVCALNCWELRRGFSVEVEEFLLCISLVKLKFHRLNFSKCTYFARL